MPEPGPRPLETWASVAAGDLMELRGAIDQLRLESWEQMSAPGTRSEGDVVGAVRVRVSNVVKALRALPAPAAAADVFVEMIDHFDRFCTLTDDGPAATAEWLAGTKCAEDFDAALGLALDEEA